MREFGTGVLNGSLWTITVELQFYVLVPFFYVIFSWKKMKNRSNASIIILILFFMLIHAANYFFLNEYGNNVFFKLFGISFLPWIYMFLCGIFFQRNFEKLHNLLVDKFLFILPIYLICSYLSVKHFGWNLGNGINPILYFFLVILVFSFAYSYPSLSKNILKGNDISYGVYIYHIPVVNIMIFYGYINKVSYVIMTLSATIFIAIISWFLIEKPILKLKKYSLNPLKPANQ